MAVNAYQSHFGWFIFVFRLFFVFSFTYFLKVNLNCRLSYIERNFSVPGRSHWCNCCARRGCCAQHQSPQAHSHTRDGQFTLVKRLRKFKLQYSSNTAVHSSKNV